MTKALAGKHALITGGSGGIGTAIAVALATNGSRVTLVGRDRARLERAAAAVPSGAFIGMFCADVTNEEDVAAAFRNVRSDYPRVDILVNAAGAASSGRFGRTTLDEWRRMIDVNLTGTFVCCREAIEPMLEAGYGRIVNVASTAGLAGYRYVAAYCAAKHGVVGLTRALALEAAASGVTVNAVCPGFTQTRMLDETIAGIVAKTGRSETQARDALLRSTPRGAFVSPGEVANTVLWLCSPGSEAITGQAIAVDGGELAG